MVTSDEHLKCSYCKRVSRPKYHNTLYPYCGLCHHDTDGDLIYTCDLCGLREPSNRMETEQTCRDCWRQLTAA